MANDDRLAAFLPHFRAALSRALEELLAEKRLYQSVTVDTSFIKPVLSGMGHRPRSFPPPTGAGSQPLGDSLERDALGLVEGPWVPDGLSPAPGESPDAGLVRVPAPIPSFPLPDLGLACPACAKRTPHGAELPRCKSIPSEDSQGEQLFLIEYRCQGCASATVTFLVRRKSAALQLVGRDPMETERIPVSLPTAVERFYEEAQAAQAAGRTLSALLLLREFIEQFWRSLPKVREALAVNPAMNPDQVADFYATLLPLDFKAQYPSLKNCHHSLREAIERPGNDAGVFQYCLSDVREHLDGRRFRRIDWGTPSPFATEQQEQRSDRAV